MKKNLIKLSILIFHIKYVLKEKKIIGKIINSPKDLVGCGSCYEDYVNS